MCRYDALLAAGDSWEELCMRAVLHGGDNDSTGAIACAWFGVLYGFTGVPECNYKVGGKPNKYVTCYLKLKIWSSGGMLQLTSNTDDWVFPALSDRVTESHLIPALSLLCLRCSVIVIESFQ